jgi:hypothetical protein
LYFTSYISRNSLLYWQPSLSKKYEGSICPQANNAIVLQRCLPSIILIDGELRFLRDILDAPFPIVPEQPGVIPRNPLILLNDDIIGKVSPNRRNRLPDREGSPCQWTSKKLDQTLHRWIITNIHKIFS